MARGPDRKPRAAKLGLTKQRRAACIAAYRRCGVLTRTAEAVGISESRLREWRHENPDFDAEMRAAAEELTIEIGQVARHALLEYFASIGSMVVTGTRQHMTRDGEIHELETSERVYLNPALVKLALGRLDPRWVAIPREVVAELARTFKELASLSDEELERRAADGSE